MLASRKFIFTTQVSDSAGRAELLNHKRVIVAGWTKHRFVTWPVNKWANKRLWARSLSNILVCNWSFKRTIIYMETRPILFLQCDAQQRWICWLRTLYVHRNNNRRLRLMLRLRNKRIWTVSHPACPGFSKAKKSSLIFRLSRPRGKLAIEY